MADKKQFTLYIDEETFDQIQESCGPRFKPHDLILFMIDKGLKDIKLNSIHTLFVPPTCIQVKTEAS